MRNTDHLFGLSLQERVMNISMIRYGSLLIMMLLLVSMCAEITDADDPVTIELYHPSGGERITGNLSIIWETQLENESCTISLYLISVETMQWIQITENATDNDGEHIYDTMAVSDGAYFLRIEAVMSDKRTGNNTSDVFIIDNDQAPIHISEVIIEDITIDSTLFVKDTDTLQISAYIDSEINLSYQDITADLRGFGYNKTAFPDQFNGTVAIWYLHNVVCQPQNGEIHVIIDVKQIENATGLIIADNSPPVITIEKPGYGIFFYNTEVWTSLPFLDTFIIGPIDIQIQGVDDSGIAEVQYSIDNELFFTTDDITESYRIKHRIIGTHSIEITVIDTLGHHTSIQKTITIYNFIGF